MCPLTYDAVVLVWILDLVSFLCPYFVVIDCQYQVYWSFLQCRQKKQPLDAKEEEEEKRRRAMVVCVMDFGFKWFCVYDLSYGLKRTRAMVFCVMDVVY